MLDAGHGERDSDKVIDYGGALARLVIDGERWAEDVPPAPAGHRVTVAFSTEDLAAEHADAIELLGYQVVGARGSCDGCDTADFLVLETVIESHPAWWRALAHLAADVYVLRLGPVRRALASALQVHERP